MTGPAAAPGTARGRRRAGSLRVVGALVGMVVLYAFAPVPGVAAPPLLGWFLFAAALGTLARLVLVLVRRARSDPDGGAVRIEALVGLLYAVVALFSWTYLGLSRRPDQFVGIQDRVDALYFTMATLGTVGYGDVHPVGTAARVVVTVQIFFDLSFLALAARLVGPMIGRPAAREERSPVLGEAAGSGRGDPDGRPTDRA